ncbi:N-6 DNA methylase [Dichotomicrobium thermohalophilum]|uniref:site-specific DNA-methyltransferase (adenine-specific) n=1 Tax=Dichotomicrobium thermohalophilum TaxID=933063 RepID=A0A397PJX6_9HYPH|nr:N-6 DNA methylase [Dichotomicrobium thermohalophilum]RIA47457.1 N-6 DNA methylase [Dichotomicrobium thermohalophilum]
MSNERIDSLLQDLARKPGHDEVKSSIRELLVAEFKADRVDVYFEEPVPEVRGRIDAVLGRTIFEVKSDLGRERADAERRVPDYLAGREGDTGERYVAVVTDGLDWIAYELRAGILVTLKEWRLDPSCPGQFLGHLKGTLAVGSELAPDAETIRLQLGAESVAFKRALADLSDAWEKVADRPTAALKRQLWQQLLRLVYGNDIEDEALWFQHTFLVIVAKAIAAKVLELPTSKPDDLLSGQQFVAHGVNGAVESDFFDWILEAPGGPDLVQRIVRHVARFRLVDVDTDVLKVLYESLIDRAQRHGLGEYYTPDWLAKKVVRHTVSDPLNQRVLDPACGSGTFLFHAVKRFLSVAAEEGIPEPERAARATTLVAGMDIHPVAAIIARVTYLLALGPVLGSRAASISIPVYVGDALQLSVKHMLAGEELIVSVPAPPAKEPRGQVATGEKALRFPQVVCRDPALLDSVVQRMQDHSEQGRGVKAFVAAVRSLGIADEGVLADLAETYRLYDELRRTDRNSIWAYVARNLSRPLYLSADTRKADVIVGNPPWLAFRHMNKDLQNRFRELSRGERVYVGGKLAAQNDLSALFFARAVALYLKRDGRIAFVMPMAALTRGQFEAFRNGSFGSSKVAFDEAWTFDDSVEPLFPVPSCVVFARREHALAKAMPDRVTAFSGRLPKRDASEEMADLHLTITENAPALETAQYEGGSAYRSAFRQGATLVPRMLCLVERAPVSRLGGNPAAPLVRSWRSRQEKEPWKSLQGLEGNVEAEFLRPVYLGESIAPFRVLRAFEGVIPTDQNGNVLDAAGASRRGLVHLASWMENAEAAWNANKTSDMFLVDRWNYHNELGAQFPVPSLRVAYATSGKIPAAVVLADSSAIVESGVYWAKLESLDEARYITTVLNSETARMRIADFQARGQWGARHFHKVMFNLPIPRFAAQNPLHGDLAAAGAEAEQVAAAIDIPKTVGFQKAREVIRTALAEAGLSQQIDDLVTRLLDGS